MTHHSPGVLFFFFEQFVVAGVDDAGDCGDQGQAAEGGHQDVALVEAALRRRLVHDVVVTPVAAAQHDARREQRSADHQKHEAGPRPDFHLSRVVPLRAAAVVLLLEYYRRGHSAFLLL